MKNRIWILWGLILLKFILQYLLIDPVYELHRDEFLHLDQARHLAWGYTSVPPVTSWISYLIRLLGNDIFWIKFFPALFGALTMLVVWKTIEELKGGWFALTLGAISVLFSILLRINTLYQPNSLDILSWTLLYFALVKYISTEKSNWLYWAAVIFALGFLNKYNMAFLILGLIPAILLTKHRQIFRNKHLYGAVALALLLISPNLIWQYQNNFPLIHHLNELAATQLVNVNRADFLKEQLLFFFGLCSACSFCCLRRFSVFPEIPDGWLVVSVRHPVVCLVQGKRVLRHWPLPYFAGVWSGLPRTNPEWETWQICTTIPPDSPNPVILPNASNCFSEPHSGRNPSKFQIV